ncbi:MAG TPA: lasso peptide biosynthesis protein [Polyangiaceae bacterium]
MRLVESARAAVQLCWLRARLPGILARTPLDTVLRELTPARTSAAFADVERAVDRAEALADRVPGLRRSCLYRELARYAVFRSFGCDPAFVLAVHPRGVEEDGHAWLEFSGVPYREPRAEEFVVSFRFPETPSAA